MKKVWQASRSPRKYAVRDHYRKRYGNPLFSRGKQRHADFAAAAGTLKRGILWMLLIGAIGGAAYYFIWSPAFTVTAVEIKGASLSTEQTLRPIIDERLNETSWLVIPERNIFFFDETTAVGAMGEKFSFESVLVRKKLPHTVTIEVKEKEPRAALAAGNRFLAVDGSGFVIRDLTDKEIMQLVDLPPDYSAIQVQGLGAESMEVMAPETSPAAPKKGATPAAPVKKNKNPLPLIVDPADPTGEATAPKPGDAVVAPGTLALILEAYTRLPDIAGSGVRWFDPDDAAEAVRVTMSSENERDWLIYFSTTVPFDIQGQRLLLVLKEKIGTRKDELEYVDLRYNERIFFRFRTPPPTP